MNFLLFISLFIPSVLVGQTIENDSVDLESLYQMAKIEFSNSKNSSYYNAKYFWPIKIESYIFFDTIRKHEIFDNYGEPINGKYVNVKQIAKGKYCLNI